MPKVRLNPSIDEGLILHLPMNEGVGTKVFDRSIYGNHGDLYNTPAWVVDDRDRGVGQILHLDSASNEHIQVTDADELKGMTALTLSLWIKYLSDTGADQDTAIKGIHGTNQPFVLWRDEIGVGTDRYGLIISDTIGDTTGANYFTEASGYIVDNVWSHIIITFAADDEARLWKDAIIHPVSVDCSGIDQIKVNATDWYFGTGGGLDRYTDAYLADVRMYNRVLPEREIRTLTDMRRRF